MQRELRPHSISCIPSARSQGELCSQESGDDLLEAIDNVSYMAHARIIKLQVIPSQIS
jgi:hypothetical protein